jgi:hypothetical protein
MGNRYREELRAANAGVGIGLRRVPGQTATTPEPQAQQQPGNEFTGTWLVKDANNRVIHRFSGIGNNQGDANRVAMQWLRSNPAQMTDGLEVVPEMR